MFDLDKFTSGGYYIQTPTIEVYEKVLEFLEENDVEWLSGAKPTSHLEYWDENQENTCLGYGTTFDGIYYDTKYEFECDDDYKLLSLDVFYWMLDKRYGFYDAEGEISSYAFDLEHAAAFKWEHVEDFGENYPEIAYIEITDEIRYSVPFNIEEYLSCKTVEPFATQIGRDDFHSILYVLNLWNTDVKWVEGQSIKDDEIKHSVLGSIDAHDTSYLLYDEDGLRVFNFSDKYNLKDISEELSNNGADKLVDNERFISKVLDLHTTKYIN